MVRIVSVAAVVLLTSGAVHASNPDSVVLGGGDVRIVGSGNGLVFPDGSIQLTATVQGPQGEPGPPGPEGLQGPAGPQGPTGTYPGQVLISPAKNLKISDTLQLVATSFDADSNLLSTHSYTWSSVNPEIASVSNSGLVTANKAGTAIITVRDTINNIGGHMAVNVNSLTGNWVATNIITPESQYACSVLPSCSLQITETQDRSVGVTTNSCSDTCGNSIVVTQTGQRTGAVISLSGTITITPPVGEAGTFQFNCRNIWDGNNSSSVTCVAPDFILGPMVLNHQYVRN